MQDGTLQLHNVRCLKTFGAFCNGELHAISFIERFETFCQYCRMMYKDIFTGIAADKPITLFVVKPLHCALFFHFFLFDY